MTQEQKELLKDLCSRLPYGVMCRYQHIQYIENGKLIDINMFGRVNIDGHIKDVCDIKPYLFPMSSMTEEQCYEFYCRFVENEIDYDDFKEYYFDNGLWHKLLTSIDDCNSVVDWFNKNNIDYRGLIPMGLAIDASKLNIY